MSQSDRREDEAQEANSVWDWIISVPLGVFACLAVMIVGAGALLAWAAGSVWDMRPRKEP